jgi:hypothetical protein
MKLVFPFRVARLLLRTDVYISEEHGASILGDYLLHLPDFAMFLKKYFRMVNVDTKNGGGSSETLGACVRNEWR